MNLIKFKDFLKKNQWLILGLITLFFIVCLSLLAIFKYNNFGYNGLDLGIYNQVFYNTAHGRLFQFTVHPHSYLGDHFELFILLLTPFYYLYQSPINLLILQIIFLAISIWPLYLIARERFLVHWSLLVCLAFLLNPFILNILFFEFHLLAFAVPLLFFVMYFYIKNKFAPFCLFIFLSLLVREDVAWVILMIGVLALIDRKKMKWALVPIIAGAAWFIMAMKLSGYFNHYGTYKFLFMYAWLGNTPGEMLKHIFTNPFDLLRQIFSLNNFLLIIGLMVPVGGISFLKPRYLVPTVLIAGQFFLTTVSTAIVLETHYTSLFLPFIYIAAVFGISKYYSYNQKNRLIAFISKEKHLFPIIILCIVVYSFATFSPIISGIKLVFDGSHRTETSIKNQILKYIKPSDAVAAGYDYVPFVSNRQNLYSMHYVFRGKKQYSQEPYILPTPANKLLIDYSDFIIYYLQATDSGSQEAPYPTGSANIRQVLDGRGFGLEKIIDDQAVYSQGFKSEISLIEKNVALPDDSVPVINSLIDPISLIAYTVPPPKANLDGTAAFSFYWKANRKAEDDYFLELTVRNKNKIEYTKIYPLDYGLYPTSQWSVDETVQTKFWFSLPDKYKTATNDLYIQLVQIKGYLDLNSLRSAIPHYTKHESVSPAWQINY